MRSQTDTVSQPSIVHPRCLWVTHTVHGHNGRQETNSETRDETSGDEHANRGGTTLKSATEDGDDSSDEDGHLTPEVICKPGDRQSAQDGAASERRHDATNLGIAGVAKVFDEQGLGNGGGDDTAIVAKEESFIGC